MGNRCLCPKVLSSRRFRPIKTWFPWDGYIGFFKLTLSIRTPQGSACNIFYTKLQGKNQQNNGKIQHLIKIFIFASTTAFFGSLEAFSEVKLQHKNQNLAPVIPAHKTANNKQITSHNSHNFRFLHLGLYCWHCVFSFLTQFAVRLRWIWWGLLRCWPRSSRRSRGSMCHLHL